MELSPKQGSESLSALAIVLSFFCGGEAQAVCLLCMGLVWELPQPQSFPKCEIEMRTGDHRSLYGIKGRGKVMMFKLGFEV